MKQLIAQIDNKKYQLLEISKHCLENPLYRELLELLVGVEQRHPEHMLKNYARNCRILLNETTSSNS
jgi:hypothetical protein